LVEKAQSQFNQEEAEELQEKIVSETFSLNDYLKQIRQMRKMGSMKSVLEMLPGMAGQISDEQLERIDQTELKREEAIILSMTKKERVNLILMGPSRRARVAKGSGTSVAEVARFLKKFEKSRSMMKKVAKNKKLQNQLMGMGGPAGRGR
jgi:signal recognition particle subunit SRP54